MGLIKSAHVPTSAAAFSMRDVENAAKGILLRARQQAEALLAAAQQEAEAMKERGYGDGLEAGGRDGLAHGEAEGAKAGAQQALAEHKAEFAAAVNALSAAAAALDASRRDLEAAGLREVIALAAAIARRVTKRQGLLDPDVLTDNLREAMKIVGHAADVRIAIHPAQKAVLEATLPSLRLTWPQLGHVELVEDPALAPGGCRVFTARGCVDADLDAQLDRVIEELLPAD